MSPTLAAEPIAALDSGRWIRAAATAAMLCAAALLTRELLASPEPPVPALKIQPAPRPLPAPIAVQTPGTRGEIEFQLTLRPGDPLSALLDRAGADPADAAAAAALVPPDAARPGTAVTIALGKPTTANRRALEQISIRTDLAASLIIDRTPEGSFAASTRTVAVDSTPLRITGRAGDGLYWSLRAAGASAEAAAAFIGAVGSSAAPADRFDLVLAHRRTAEDSEEGPLLFAALDRAAGRTEQRVRWGAEMVDPARPTAHAALVRPVAGRLTSAFGRRVHPILRFVRFHQGADIAAAWGSAVVAAADGTVVGSGWDGGHGRRVRIAHAGGRTTGYSHLSRIEARPGATVRQGELIGFVGSSGFSTGPHLHFELHADGRPVDPFAAGSWPSRPLAPADRAGMLARVRQLRAIPAAA